MKNSVKLLQEQRGNLQQLISTGHTAARKLMHARILLKVDESQEGPGWSDEQVHEALDRQPQPQRPEKRRLDGDGEAHLIALLCAGKPEEQARWSMRLLAEKLVQLGEVDHISYETVRQTLKKTNSSRGSRSNGALPLKRMQRLWRTWKMSWKCTNGPMMNGDRRCVWMRQASN